MNTATAKLVLEDGTVLDGTAFGALGVTLGEAVFATGMTGYQETLTDPSYAGQIVVQTAPHIGNTGMNRVDEESSRIWVEGYVVREPARRSSNWRSEHSLREVLEAQGVVGIADVDTRAVTRRLRETGSLRAGIFSGNGLVDEQGNARLDRDLLAEVRRAPGMQGASFVDRVTAGESVVIPPAGEKIGTVAALDLGIKSSSPRHMAERGLEVHVLPAGSSLADVLAVQPDAVFFSNGPGDPATADHQVALLREILDRRIPYFGICFGNQILGRALGYGTYKLRYGHRGINQPVLDRETGRVEITAQNHGFAVDAPLDGPSVAPYDDGRYGRVIVSHVGLNDQVVEGLKCLDVPAFSVQYHPEAASGPHDASYLFDRLVDLVTAQRGTAPAPTSPASRKDA